MMRRLALLAALAQPPQVDQLAWMAGCWSLSAGPTTIEEQWSRPAGGAMLGMSRILKNGRMVFHEFMRIEEKDGALVFTPRIGSGAPVTFRAAAANFGDVTFENPAHDFPQRVIYRRQPDGGLHGMIDGVEKGKPRAEQFPYRRVPCP